MPPAQIPMNSVASSSATNVEGLGIFTRSVEHHVDAAAATDWSPTARTNCSCDFFRASRRDSPDGSQRARTTMPTIATPAAIPPEATTRSTPRPPHLVRQISPGLSAPQLGSPRLTREPLRTLASLLRPLSRTAHRPPSGARIRRCHAGDAGLGNLPLAIGGAVGVAVFGSLFFQRISPGSPSSAYRVALLVQGGLLIAFIALAFFFPRKARLRPGGRAGSLRPLTASRWAGRPSGAVGGCGSPKTCCRGRLRVGAAPVEWC